MAKKITPAIKGFITGLLMVAVGLTLNFSKVEPTSPLQYISYFIYGLGIVWTVQAFAKQTGGTAKFGEMFNQGFRCFVVVTLIMALYTFIFYKILYAQQPELLEKSAIEYKNHLLKTEKSKTPVEIDEIVANSKKYSLIFTVSVQIFFNLLIGAIVTAATAGALSLSKKN